MKFKKQRNYTWWFTTNRRDQLWKNHQDYKFENLVVGIPEYMSSLPKLLVFLK